ncbi:MAG: DNA alkylation repair protein [Bacteroidota bacterium]
MEFEYVISKLEEYGTEQNRKIYKRHGAGDNQFGVSFANLHALKKQVVSPAGRKGVDLDLSQKLWKTGNTDEKIFSCLITPPDEITETEIKKRVKNIQYYLLADIFGEMVSRTPYAEKMLQEWIYSKDEYIARAGFVVLNHLSMKNNKLEDDFFLPFIELAEKKLQTLPNRAKEGFNNCLISIGARNESLRDRVLEAAKTIGPVEVDHGDTSCQTFIIEEYLEKIYQRKKK